MISFSKLRLMALSFPETSESPHFDKVSFRYKKKIFATYNEKEHHACLKLSESNQFLYSKTAPGIVYPVNNKWGQQGWTLIELKQLPLKLFEEVLRSAYEEVAFNKSPEFKPGK
jgi:hypothetical protein